MKNKEKHNYGDDFPITAFATTPGNSALTLIRCSGKESIELFASIFDSPAKIKDALGNTVVHGWIPGIDEVLVSVFRSPKSYTGEDCLDICCHGGPVAGKAVMEAVKSAGFRDALPGEFTFRAFMNGKMDLTRSESVMELVSAKTETGRKNAISRLSGALQTEVNEIKQILVQVLAGAEIYLDYSEDEVSAESDESAKEEIAGKLPNKELAKQALDRLQKLYPSWQVERIYQEGVTIVIAGQPNAGKSNLFNSFLKEDRSIVADTPGTTRDWIEAWINIKGIPIRLIDTAGIRETKDPVELIGVERSLELLKEAQIVLYLVDCTIGVTDKDRKFILEYATQAEAHGQIYLLVWNKIDIAPLPQKLSTYVDLMYKVKNAVSISAKTGEGMDDLNYEIVSAVMESHKTSDVSASLGTERQKKLIGTACTALEEALGMAENNEPLDLIAPLLRESVNALGEITGEISTADILEEMFSKFCVGK
ncbi:MAG: tRNA uridine-5-carboxymethylaminomethyl(34) synthesis GTPase MnmE [Treponema sp.]|jgi:tRNA modification GTPase|nr:tRNA uridine-5-carboxymethylaminomethyl(34) synthesis GTPase MnmE [Treponema sp.]